jgi:hypothetical protein
VEMSGDGHKRDDQPNVLTVVAAAATAGALIVGILGAASSFFSEQEEPVRETANTSRSSRGSGVGPRGCSRSGSELEDWLFHNSRPSPEQDDVPQGLLCKICESRQITHVLACGHTLCQDCAAALIKTSRRCPFDRDAITRAPQKMYM